MPPPLLLLQNISLTFGTKPLLSGAALAAGAGDRICLVGRNGSGKSTLLRVAAGLVEPDGGERFVQPGARVSYLPQEQELGGFATTLAYVEAGFDAGAAIDTGPSICSRSSAFPARKIPGRCPAERHAAPRWPGRLLRCPTSCCSTSRPTTSTSPASNGWRASWPARAPGSC